MTLEKCALCPNTEDPRFGYIYRERRYPLCDGCGGPENADQKRELWAKLESVRVAFPVRRFEVYLDRQVAGLEPSVEVLEFSNGETDKEIADECRDALDTMIGNELDTGWRELVSERQGVASDEKGDAT